MPVLPSPSQHAAADAYYQLHCAAGFSWYFPSRSVLEKYEHELNQFSSYPSLWSKLWNVSDLIGCLWEVVEVLGVHIIILWWMGCGPHSTFRRTEVVNSRINQKILNILKNQPNINIPLTQVTCWAWGHRCNTLRIQIQALISNSLEVKRVWTNIFFHACNYIF